MGILLAALFIIVLLIAAGFAIDLIRREKLRNAFTTKYGPQGRDLLLVYSDSPHWKTYIESHWLPKYAARAVVLNWSARSQWTKAQYPESAIFRYYGGNREYNPMAIVFPKKGKAQVVRFWRAFRDFKHGKDAALRQSEAELDRYLTT